MLALTVLAIVLVLVLGRLGLVSKKQTKLRPGVRWFAIGSLLMLLLFILVVFVGKF
jgi:hypothetical protein